jgi:uncharacterized protein with HEPN domain
MSHHQFLRNRQTQLATERCIEIIGEAARRVSAPCRQDHPEIPWLAIISQRNVIAHEYDSIKQDRMWEVATVHIPQLIALIEPLLPPLDPPEL